MEYITLCLDTTNELEQWYVRHNNVSNSALPWSKYGNFTLIDQPKHFM